MKSLVITFICLGMNFAMADTLPPNRNNGATSTQRGMAAEELRRALPLLREGDVIFIRREYPLYRILAKTYGSWESHLGILFRNSRGAWTVAQSTIPVSKVTLLETFVAGSKNGRFLVRRFRGGLSAAAVQRLRTATDCRMGVLYDSGFNYDSSRQYCSKFVYDSYLGATGQRVGKLETFRDIFVENPEAPLAFWRAWFFGRIPWERRVVTTSSQLRAANLVTVFDTENGAR